jgi:hypothetical protein
MKNQTGRPGSITGRILTEGKPATGLEVTLLPQRSHIRDEAIATTRTDEYGRYWFSEVPSSFYWLRVVAPEYITTDNWDDEGPGRNVSVADGESVENVDLDLILGGVITGRITDSQGNPIVGEYVELTIVDECGLESRPQTFEFEDDFETDDGGAYRVYGIPPGRYLVSVGVDIALITGAVRDKFGSSDQMGQVDGDHYFEQTYYPGVSDRARAQVLDVKRGGEITDVNFRVGQAFRAFKVSGRVIYSDSHQPIDSCHIQLGHKIGGSYRSSYCLDGPSDTDEDGNFTVSELVPGCFFVSAQFDSETELYCKPVEFEIKDDDIEGLEIKAHRGLTISGSVMVEGASTKEVTAKLARLKLRTDSHQDDGCSHDFREAAVNSDGSFTIRGLRPGRVQVSLGFEDVSWYFSMVRIEYQGAGGEPKVISVRNQRDTPPILLGESGLKGVRIVLSYKNGSIRGHVNMMGVKLDSGARLSSGISWHTANAGWSTSTEVDANGNFAIDGLEPGEYSISVSDRMRSFSQTKTVIVKNDFETSVLFVIDASARRKEL